MLEEHVKYLQAIFEQLQKLGLRLHHGKYKFFYDRLPYLGHMIVSRGFGVQEVKVDTLWKILAPVNVPWLHATFASWTSICTLMKVS